MPTTREELEQIREQSQRGWLKGENCPDCGRMSKALLAVLDLHGPNQWGECDTCTNWEGRSQSFPCPTVAAIEREMGRGR
jgi:hypothetical protein